MSKNFTGEQYQNAFQPKHLQNYEIPKGCNKKPVTQDGFTKIIATDRGHLLPGTKKSTESPWGDFVGTWDMPKKIPGARVPEPMGRTQSGHQRLMKDKEDADFIIMGRKKALDDAYATGLSPNLRDESSMEPRSGAKCPTHEPPPENSPPVDSAVPPTNGQGKDVTLYMGKEVQTSPQPAQMGGQEQAVSPHDRHHSGHDAHGIPHVIDKGLCQVETDRMSAQKYPQQYVINSPGQAYTNALAPGSK